VHAFAFFGAVPQSVLYDNDRCLVAKIMPDGTRNRTQRFSAMLSHYVIRDRYGRPGKGNDKGKVEGLVGYSRRNFMVPMPRFASWDAFNDYLEEQCLKRQTDIACLLHRLRPVICAVARSRRHLWCAIAVMITQFRWPSAIVRSG